MGVAVEVVAAHEREHIIDHVVLQQATAEDAAFGFKVLGRNSVEQVVRGIGHPCVPSIERNESVSEFR